MDSRALSGGTLQVDALSGVAAVVSLDTLITTKVGPLGATHGPAIETFQP